MRSSKIVSTKHLCRAAEAGGYAVAAVNILDMLSLRAVLQAAAQERSPIIIQVSVKTVKSLGLDYLTQAVDVAASEVNVPVALHLDHCPDRAVISDVVRAGWSSVLFDASDRDLAQATQETHEVVVEAHAAGVEVESEIENIIGVEDGVGSDEALHAYSIEQLCAIAAEASVDLLAPQLGTAHGLYTRVPVLLPDRARRARELIDIPVVLHGGTGLTDDQFRSFVDAGVSKINISTAIKRSYMQAAEAHLADARARNKWDPPSMFKDISTAITDTMVPLLRTFGSSGRVDA